MAKDRREEILARLVEVAGSIDGVKTVARNQQQMSDHLRPAIVVVDANEEGASGDFALGRPSVSQIMHMTPEIYIMVGGRRETLGSAANALRVALIRAVLGDGPLIISVGSTGGIQYQGCVLDLSRGATAEAEMMVTFNFHYPMRLSEL